MSGNSGSMHPMNARRMRATPPAENRAKRIACASNNWNTELVHSTDLRQLNLTILHEDPHLFLSLTDSRALARVGSIDVPASRLDALKTGVAPALRQQAACAPETTAASGAASERRNLGSVIFSQLLPEGIRAFLVQSPGHYLHLQLSDSLIAIPWELAFDGENIPRREIPDFETNRLRVRRFPPRR